MSNPNPKLLSLLHKISNPITNLQITIKLHGIYQFPEEWKTNDELNPGIFGYTTSFLAEDLPGGKVYPREFTEKEKREQEEQLAAKAKKGKKEAKQELTPEEEEQLKRQKEIEEEEEHKKQEYMATLNEQDKFYFISEDRFMNHQIRFEDSKIKEITDDAVKDFEVSIYNRGGDWVFFTKHPLITEEEIAKLKKGKPKNLNLLELQPIRFKTWCKFNDFQIPGCTHTIQRCPLQQIQEEGSDAPQYNLAKTYLKIEITTDQAITPKVDTVKPSVMELISRNEPVFNKAPSRNDCVASFRNEISLAMESLANEYIIIFQKDSNDQKQKKAAATMTEQKKQELQKKKETFLGEINSSGKYKLLKERLRHSIVRVCIDKFQKEGHYSGVTKDEKDRLLAELYVFLMEEMQKTLAEFINNNKEEIHEDLIAAQEQNIKERERVFATLTRESNFEKCQRLATEYEILNQEDQAIKYYLNMISINDREHKNLYQFAKYCLRVRKFIAAEQLISRANKIEPLKEYKLIIICLYIRRERYREAEQMIQELLKTEPINTLYNLIMSFIAKLKGNQKLSDKYKRVTERIFMRTMGLITSKKSHKIQPDPHILPNLRQQLQELQELAKKAPSLTNEQLDHIQCELIDYLSKLNLMDLVEKALSNILDKTTPKMTILKAQIHIYNQNQHEALVILNKFLEQNPKNYDVHLIKGTLCYETEQFYEAEETFLNALRIKLSKPFAIYLRLGFMYLKRKSWNDAKIIFQKALNLSDHSNSSLSWLGLGISSLRLKELAVAEECLTQSNIYEPFNGETLGYMALLCLQMPHRSQQAIQCIQRMNSTEVNDLELLEELGDEMFKCQNYEASKNLFKRIFLTKKQLPNLGQLHLKLGKVINVFDSLKKPKQAREQYEKALQFLEGENEKAQVMMFMDNLQYD